VKILVQKFGGTSVAAKEMRICAAKHIERAKEAGYGVVVVVSAMGRRGEPYATDTLLDVPEDSGAVTERDLAILMSCGEAISSVVFATLLRSRGHAVTVMNGLQAGIVTNDDYTNARVLEIHPGRILSELEQGNIVVVMGFQGATVHGEVTTLGRGGSDTTATALGVALGAEYVDIFTDVEGIMTADPRIVEDARQIRQVTYTEICNLAYQGAKVIHPRAVEIAMQKNIPIRVRSTASEDEGTLVTSALALLETSIVTDRPITGVTQTANVTRLEISATGAKGAEVFQLMANHGISVDFISVCEGRVMYTVPDAKANLAISVLEQAGHQVSYIPSCAKVSCVGAGIAGTPGIMARIATALAEEQIEILQFADSHTTMWCLVRQEQMEQAVRALHQAFRLGERVFV
jgi:aspartate kinase